MDSDSDDINEIMLKEPIKNTIEKINDFEIIPIEEKKQIIPFKVINNKLENIIKSFNEEHKDPILFINKLDNFYEEFKDEPEKIDKAENNIINYLLSITDKEGNKLFHDAQQAKQFLILSRQKGLNKKYKLPKVLKQDIKEKKPLKLTEFIKKSIIKY